MSQAQNPRNIDSLMAESRTFPPPADLAAAANAQPGIYEQDPDGFWYGEGRNRLSWFTPGVPGKGRRREGISPSGVAVLYVAAAGGRGRPRAGALSTSAATPVTAGQPHGGHPCRISEGVSAWQR